MSNVFEELKQRGFVQQTTGDEELQELLASPGISCYIGFDPTAASLHAGSLVPIMALAHMQRAGHRPIAVIGGGTGLVGDPTGKTEMRQLLEEERVAQNLAAIKAQIGKYINFSDDAALAVNNADWLKPLNYIEFLRTIGAHFSVNRMLAAEAYKQRLERGLSFLEFNYMILQAYDFLVLFQRHNCQLQMGGDDQWGNILAGVELIRRVAGGKAHAITFPLLLTASGAKMGKSEAGAIWLDSQLMSPYQFFQFWRNTDDRDVHRFLLLFTFLPLDEIAELNRLQATDINRVKERLAFEATAITHGKEAARQAMEDARQLFGAGQKGAADSIPTVRLDESRLAAGVPAVDLLCESGLATSKSEARKLIRGGGAFVNEEKITDELLTITKEHIVKDAIVLRAGKKRYAKIVLE